MSIMLVIGTRPEIVKMAPVVKSMEELNMDYTTVHTNQHYDQSMNGAFFEELKLPEPDEFLETPKKASHAEQTSHIMIGIERLIRRRSPSLVVVEGDTNTVMATALTAVKSGVPVAHVEAGLRSHDMRMPEELNRKITDNLSSLLFAPTEQAKKNLINENIRGKTFVTGNTVIDSCIHFSSIAMAKSRITDRLRFDEYALATIHRAENVDERETLAKIVEIIERSPIPIVFPIHPRTSKMLKFYGLFDRVSGSKNIQLIDPVGYFDFLKLMVCSKFILTDSGGIQEEATAPTIRKLVLVLRESTERPEAVKAGFCKVVGTDPEIVLSELDICANKVAPNISSPYGDGTAGRRIAEIIKKQMEDGFEVDLLRAGFRQGKKSLIEEEITVERERT